MTPPQFQYDVAVIGAGAAGLMAAASAARPGKHVILLEKNKKIGVKILMSGGTRCNITNNCDQRGIIEAFGKNGRFLHSALAALPPTAVVRAIESQGVPTKIETTGKVFPVSDRAIDVRDALLRLAAAARVEIQSETPVLNIRKNDKLFEVETSTKNFVAPNVIITTGGKSYPGCGTTGDGYRWAAHFGHSIVEPFPALTPVLTRSEWAHQLKGITIDQVHVQIIENPARSSKPDVPGSESKPRPSKKQAKPKVMARQTGSFLFTHWGFSGPAVLDVSREVARYPGRKSCEMICDFLPGQSVEQLMSYCREQKDARGKQSAGSLLCEFFPKRLATGLVEAAQIDPASKTAELSKGDLAAICERVKSARFAISGTLGFEKAEVTSGGVSLKEVDSKTMQSKLVPGLYFAGEILDLDGRIGGFNFQSAFSTGWLAGQSV